MIPLNIFNSFFKLIKLQQSYLMVKESSSSYGTHQDKGGFAPSSVPTHGVHRASFLFMTLLINGHLTVLIGGLKKLNR